MKTIRLALAAMLLLAPTVAAETEVQDGHDCSGSNIHSAEAPQGQECVNFAPNSGLQGIPGSWCWTDWMGPAITQMFCTTSGCSVGGTLGCAGGGQSFSLWCPAINGVLPMVEAQKDQAACLNGGSMHMLSVECGNNGRAYYSAN